MSRRGWLLFLGVSVLWGIPYLLIKIALVDLHPAVIVFSRCLLAAVLLFPIAAVRGQLGSLRSRWRWIVAFSLIEITVPFVCVTLAETRLSSSLTGLLIAMVPLLAAVTARAIGLDARIGPARLAGLLVGLLGVALLVGVDLRGAELLAALAIFVAAVGYTIGPLILTLRLSHLPSVATIAAAQVVTAVVMLPFAIAYRPTAPVAPEVWGAVATLGVVASAVAFLAFFALVAEVGPARASVITYLNPVVALALGVSILDEDVTTGMLVGFPLVIAGSVLATRRSAATTPADPAPALTGT